MAKADGFEIAVNDMLGLILEMLTDKRDRAYDRGDSDLGSEIGRQINILGGAIVEIGALSVKEHNRIVEGRHNERGALPPFRGISSDVITARLTIERHLAGHDDADLEAAAGMLQRVADRLEGAALAE